MNQDVENYLYEVIQEALTQASITGVQIVTGTSSDVLESDSDAILVACDELEGVVSTLKIAKARIIVRTSALSGDRGDHSALADLVSAVFHAPLPAAFLMGVTSIDVNGSHVSLHRTGSGEGKTWMTELEVSLGVKIAPASSSVITYNGAILTYG
ncbi:MAG: hypothetical protein GY811_05900 [Myxococcales bacterium]|nr:hypothetical protein [Myxococcales bacterium]